MVPVPIRCRIPEHLERIGQTQQWLADKAGMSKQQINNYVKMRHIPGHQISKHIAHLLKVACSDDLYEWDLRRE